MSVVVDDDSDVGRSPARGESHGSGLSQANWQDEGAMMSSAFPLLDAAWERLSLKEKYQRLLIHLELMVRKTTWSGLSMQEKLAAVDPRNHDGHGGSKFRRSARLI